MIDMQIEWSHFYCVALSCVILYWIIMEGDCDMIDIMLLLALEFFYLPLFLLIHLGKWHSSSLVSVILYGERKGWHNATITFYTVLSCDHKFIIELIQVDNFSFFLFWSGKKRRNSFEPPNGGGQIHSPVSNLCSAKPCCTSPHYKQVREEKKLKK